MKTAKLNNMINGWFIGNFEPSMCKTDDLEVAVKRYKRGDCEDAHYHKVADEYTVIISGRVKMFNQIFEAGDIIMAERGDATSFEALEDTVNVVVKLPCVKGDKYLVKENLDA